MDFFRNKICEERSDVIDLDMHCESYDSFLLFYAFGFDYACNLFIFLYLKKNKDYISEFN